MYHNQDLLGAMKLLSVCHRLIIDDDHIVPMDEPNVVPCVGPHYIDHTLYVGSRQGLDAGLPKILADHNWQVILDLANVHRLWPDSNVAGLPFNPMGHMVYIGTRLQEQLWVALVPRTFFEPNHLDNARATHPTLNEPTTALSQLHSLMFIMFIAYALGRMHLQDIHCSVQYPVPLTRATVKRSTDILGRDGENHHHIILQLEDWVDQAPLQWKEDNFLVNNAPVGVTIRYGQNKPLVINGALDFTFSLATHMSYLDVREWCNVHNYRQHEDDILYDKSNNNPMRTEVDLEDLPLLDEEGFEVNIYNEQGFRVPRRAPVQFSTCGALLNLHSVHELFHSEDDAHGNAHNKAPFDIYPLACTKMLGSIQSRSIMSHFPPHLTRIDNSVHPPLIDGDEDGEDIDVDVRVHGALVLHRINSQVYNELSHRIRNEAKFHPIQLGMISAALSGTVAKGIASRHCWTQCLNQCNNNLPHKRFNAKVSGNNQPQALQFENTYTLDVYRMKD
ncbi:hypothetical protein BD769DRAFT_1665695 [Suillus cothurnatus]|nr:hypothetical protein BD769DRAFT_1665695 [Suillus cothurnatus]